MRHAILTALCGVGLWAPAGQAQSWVELTPAGGKAPAPRQNPAAVYDPLAHRMVVFGGRSAAGDLNDVWAFDLELGTWTAFDPPESRPNVRYGTASVFDPVRQPLVTFAGFTDEGRFEDTWRFDPGSSAWMQVARTTVPGRRCLHAAATAPDGRWPAASTSTGSRPERGPRRADSC